MKFLLIILAIFFLTVPSVFAITAVDSAMTVVSLESYKCVKNFGYERAIIRGYFESYCGNPGGDIDKTFIQSYTNAVNAGFTQIDVYMFPCTGIPKCCVSDPTPECLATNFTCKTPQEQVNQLVQWINNTKINGGQDIIVQTVWLDVETDPASNNWPPSNTTLNQKTLQEFKYAWDGTMWNWGIYARANDWATITGDKNWVLDSTRPLWVANFDNIINLTQNFSQFGGWMTPTGKQYKGTDYFCCLCDDGTGSQLSCSSCFTNPGPCCYGFDRSVF
ncbi:uncharacterized protein OCT59_005531 [Rhizophagus irregularis]|uniref:Glycoside hydrolase family 25 protein n=3 Tax=Rhizophagus irregularis TaxID=588596 RepID=A0A015L1R9_RHIIW|nr:glycoside hydrolase family 25 protein [Rhizophagus irregularis DAOM 181602=DAOM 197198]EXX73744.1 hypothetical protein RirG_057730 [Rhizophagus irregularis DAOM 197198w]POG63319.1 glycoside hydrolase family 25 protein [Rhizophagus irregularis DAOM 181602=DAOM 197198]UZO14060.1 hypothetical protein OCT59_005531 [Rhizophagus irregularis]CAG8436724.1 22178_t:CDS:2 [Rhizophagus irregularis]|eukprot:XP_025170185.1 glycoside hydrolase family 25 protein [Rhizophagus irregularis DAOM 181602=DAOM 197198]